MFFGEESPLLDENIKKDIKEDILVKTCSEHTRIFVLAIAKDHARNKLNSIVYKETSTPLAGYTYDAKVGQYYVECFNSIDLGTIPISFSIRVDTISRWESRIPLSEFIIKKYLNKGQRYKLRTFKSKNDNCRFEFMQLVSCY
jgi:hypothetical protein